MMLVTVEFGLRPGNETRFESAVDEAHALLDKYDGFLGEEPCRNLFDDNKFVTLFYFRDRDAIKAWREDENHLRLQKKGRESIFSWYRIRIAEVERQYGYNETEGSGLPSQQ